MIDLWIPPKPAIVRPSQEESRRFSDPKKANFAPGWFPAGAAGPKGPDLSLVSSGADETNQLVFTFSSVSFGAALAGRLLILALAGGSASDGVTLSSVTIGGVSATIHAQANNTGNTNNGHAAVVSAVVAAGASGDLVVTWATALGLMNNTNYALYRATGLVSATPTDTATGTGNSPALSIDRSDQGFIIAAANGVSASSFSWPSPMAASFENADDGTLSSLANTPVTAGAVTNFSAGPTSPDAQGPSRYAAASWA